MSTRNDIYYGYGWNQKVLGRIDDDKILEAFRNHMPETFKEFFANLDEINSDILTEYESEFGHCPSQYNVIAEIISTENDIEVLFIDEPESSECAVMFTEKLPWQLNENEKALTQDKLDTIFAGYAKELGIPDAIADECRVEVWG